MERRRLGRTAVEVTRLGLGCAALGNLYEEVEDQTASDTVHAAYEAGVRHFDTAPMYGSGLSESRLGQAIARLDRDELTISTKVGWALDPLAPGESGLERFPGIPPLRPRMDLSAAAIRRSFEDSLVRLGTGRVDVVWIHDPDESSSIRPNADPYEVSHFAQAMEEAYPVLDAMRADGTIGALGVGMNQWEMLADFARAGAFDCFLLAGRYSLLEQGGALHELLPLCERDGISVVIGAPFASGILAGGAYFNYAPASKEVRARVRALGAVCERHGVALPAAALQFPLAHPAAVSVIPGARSPQELLANVEHLATAIPAALWEELRQAGLIDPAAPVPS